MRRFSRSRPDDPTRDLQRVAELERALAASERRFSSLADSSPAGIFAVDLAGRLRFCSDRFAEILDLSEHERAGREWAERIVPEDRGRVLAELHQAGRELRPVLVNGRIRTRAGQERWVRVHCGPIVVPGEEPRTWTGALDDITEEVAAHQALTTREAEFRLLAEHSSDVLTRHDAQGRYRYVSPACETLFGYRPEDLIGRTPFELGITHVDDAEVLRAAAAAARATGTARRATYRVHPAGGGERWVETALRVVAGDGAAGAGEHDRHGRHGEIVAVTRDVTERKLAEEETAHRALHDELTGLPNRTLFLDRLRAAQDRARADGSLYAVLFLDLDRFKVVNDSLGHAAGDRLLVEVARRLQAALTPGALLARFGGDELSVLCGPITDRSDAVTLAERLVGRLARPLRLAGGEVVLRASVGIALGSGAKTAEEIVRDADAAMYRAKERGRARIVVFDERLRAAARERLELEAHLRRALASDELLLHYQPVVDLRTRTVTGFEALARWAHPAHGLLAPDRFIPMAEETGLIVPLGRWVLRTATQQTAAWRRELGEEVDVNVNVVTQQLALPGFPDEVQAALDAAGLPPSRLVLEITESAVADADEPIEEALRAIRATGVRIALDDFGTGFSSLGRVARFPLDVLKIDRSFVARLGVLGTDVAIAGAVVSLARGLGLRTVAEGVETAVQQEVLEDLGCAEAQGFGFARPLPERLARMHVGTRMAPVGLAG